MGLLTKTAEPAKEILGVATIDVVADKGYFKIEDIEACEKAGDHLREILKNAVGMTFCCSRRPIACHGWR